MSHYKLYNILTFLFFSILPSFKFDNIFFLFLKSYKNEFVKVEFVGPSSSPARSHSEKDFGEKPLLPQRDAAIGEKPIERQEAYLELINPNQDHLVGDSFNQILRFIPEVVSMPEDPYALLIL